MTFKEQADTLVRWVCKSEEFPGGMLYENRADALEASYNYRQGGWKYAYVRKMTFTQAELDEFIEYD